MFSTVFFHLFFGGRGLDQTNPPRPPPGWISCMHAWSAFSSPTSKNCGGFWGSEFWGLKLSTLKKGEYIRRDKIGRIFMAKGYTPLIVLRLYNLNWKNPEFFFSKMRLCKISNVESLEQSWSQNLIANKTCRNPSFNWMAPAVSYARLLPLRRLQARFWDTPLQGGSSQLVSR